MLVARSTCGPSSPCFSANHAELVSAAFQHKKAVWLDEFTPNGMAATMSYYMCQLYDFFSRSNPLPEFIVSFLPRYQLLTALNVRRKGFQCYFRSDNDWDPNVTAWEHPFEHTEGDAQWTPHHSVVLPQTVHMKLTTNMIMTEV